MTKKNLVSLVAAVGMSSILLVACGPAGDGSAGGGEVAGLERDCWAGGGLFGTGAEV